MKGVKVTLKDAQRVKRELIDNDCINQSYKPYKTQSHIIFPINFVPDHLQIVEHNFEKKEEKPNFHDLLTIPKELINKLPSSQERVGDIMILEIPQDLVAYETNIANAYLKTNKDINTIVKKTDVHHGVFRTRGVEVLAGINTKRTIHKENGVRLAIHLEQTYFSARLSNERMRVAKQVKHDDVLVMFSGAAPYPLVIWKHAQPKSITGIEINPKAHELAMENLKLNKCTTIKLYNDDVRNLLPTLGTFDRIIMPLPKTSEEFLPLTLQHCKPGTIIHLYTFLHVNEFETEKDRLSTICERAGRSVVFNKTVPCGQHAPYIYRVCYDITVQ